MLLDRIKPTTKLPTKLSRRLYTDDINAAGESYVQNIKQEKQENNHQYLGNNHTNCTSTDSDDLTYDKYEQISQCSPKCGEYCNKENLPPKDTKPPTISREITNFIRFTNAPLSQITAIEHPIDAKLSISINQKIVYMSKPTN